jgi:pleuromutilin/lincosamide/streptogramin A transport system ATP-binding/permease protein
MREVFFMTLLFEASQVEMFVGGRRLFKADQLRIADGERIGLVGMNGSGKTTLLRLIAGEAQPDAGSVRIAGSRAVIPQLKPDEGTLSGGETTALYMERALAGRAALLLADEPTMHLDADHIRRLEKALAAYEGAVVVVSHDREFLDRVCTRIWAIEDGVVTAYSGNYSFYREARDLARRQHREQYEAYVDKRRQLEEAIRLKAQKAVRVEKRPRNLGPSEARMGKDYFGSVQKGIHRSIRALRTRIEKLERVDKPREPERVRMSVPEAARLGSRAVIRVEGLEARAGGRLLWRDVRFALPAGSKTALLGPNGSGKTTLLKRIVERSEGVSIAPAARIGYFSQNLDLLRPERSVMDNVTDGSAQPPEVVRAVLARLLFRRDDVYKPVGVLSGGERVRTALAKLIVGNVNVMVLDEPTNFLDIPSIEALETLLADYEGTVLFATHDRRFADRTANRILEIRDGRVHVFEGGYREYEERKSRMAEAGDAALEEELMTVETKLSETLGKLSMPGPGDDPEALDATFRELAAKRNELRRLLGKA